MPRKVHPKTQRKGDAGGRGTGERRSARVPKRMKSEDDTLQEGAIVQLLSSAFPTAENESPAYREVCRSPSPDQKKPTRKRRSKTKTKMKNGGEWIDNHKDVETEPANTTLEQRKVEPKRRRRNNRKTKREDSGEWMDGHGDINVTAEPTNFQRDEFKISRARSSSQRYSKKRKVVSEEADASSSADHDSEVNEETVSAEDLRLFLDYKVPRSADNVKFEDVYATIPHLRNASPPRFTTKGVKKQKMKHEELGVRVVGKTLGNPYSNYGKRRNGVVYGNQPLKTVEEMEKYAGAAINVKKALQKQAETLRLSSYVRPKLLAQVRQQHATPKTGPKEEEDDVDIETIDEVEIELTTDSPNKKKTKKGRRGRKPGRTVLECEDCGYKTTHSSHMKIHIMCVHKDVKFLECQYEGCSYKCARKGSMTRHEKCVHRKDKVFSCDQCSFTSAWSISLERHIITKHEKLRPWTCEICKKSFGQQFTLTTHMNTVHKKIKRIKCAFCPFRSTTRVSVRAHIIRMHREEIEKAMNDAEDEGADSEGQTAEKQDTTDLPLVEESEVCEATESGGLQTIAEEVTV